MVEKLIRYILLAAVISISMVLFAQDKPQEKKSSIGKTIKKTIETIDKQTLYKEKKETEQDKAEKKQIQTYQQADFDKLKDATHEDISTIIVLLGEIPLESKNSIFAPAILYNKNNIFNSNTDFAFTWVGFKATAKFTQKKFIWDNVSLQETLIGSFLYASGTNFGFFGERFNEDLLFYTNYTSEIVTLKISLPLYNILGLTIDSRQYFFIKRDTPPDFIMPKNHYNLFPRIDWNIEHYTEQGIDQLFNGIAFQNWIGYGIRSQWDTWGEPGKLQMGKEAKTFVIYSSTLTCGKVFGNSQNLIVRMRIKGGIDNDFLSQPRFGGTIDNAKLDVVHGTTVDQFRVESFALCNVQYGFNVATRLRMNLYVDYAYIINPASQHIAGSGYGFRILGPGGLPIWLTHGISKNLSQDDNVSQVVMIMTAAGF
ncbi:MAG TPA: hypothetical protein PK348_06940 [Spirochaetota bacterium]|nr:hypothetical protein [Spirochaetota bacterium]